MLLALALLCMAQPAPAGQLVLSAEPGIVRLGADARAVVRLQAPSRPRFTASAGVVRDVREESPGRWVAEYLPPDDALPQVALLTVLAGEQSGWLAIPLWGQGDAEVKTRPRGRIEVTIGAQSFGPVLADDKGVALVPVTVPPGVKEARHGLRSIDLHVPETRTVQTQLAVDEVRADQEAQVRAIVAVSTARGEPRQHAPLVLTATGGAVSQPRELAPGLFEVWWTVPAGAAGDLQLTASLVDAAPLLAARATLRRVPGPAARVALVAARSAFTAGEPLLRARATVRDAAGNPASAAFTSSLGTLSATSAGPGEYELSVEVPPSFQGARELRLFARPSADAPVLAEAAVRLAPAPAARLEVLPERGWTRADGQSPLRLALELRDRFGNPVDGLPPALSAERGTVSAAARTGAGAYVATYVAPLDRVRGSALVDLRAGGVSARTRLVLLPELQRGALSPKLGFATNLSRFNAPVVAVEAALRTERFGPQLGLLAEASWTYSSLAQGAGPASARSRLDLAALAALAAWRIPIGDRSLLQLAAGPSLNSLWHRLSVGSSTVRERAVVPGAQLSIAGERRTSAGVFFGELRGSQLADPALSSLRGSLRTLAIFAGVRFEAL